MSSKQLHLLLSGLILMLLIGIIAGAYGTNSMLSSQADQLAIQKALSEALGQEQVGLKSAKKGIDQYKELEQIAHTVVPEDKNQAEAIREIVKIAAANGIPLTSITFPASSLGSNVAATGSSTPTSSATPSASSSTNTKSLSQLLQVKSIPGVYQLPITITRDNSKTIPYNKFISFLSDLEHNRRTAQVSSISISPDVNDSGKLSFILVVNEYIKP